MTTLVWKDKQDVCKLANMHAPPTEGNFCDEHRNAIKPGNCCGLHHAHGIC
jgi:hypothetical protein